MITGYSDSLHTQHQEASLKILVELLNVLRVPGCTYIHDETKINNSGTV